MLIESILAKLQLLIIMTIFCMIEDEDFFLAEYRFGQNFKHFSILINYEINYEQQNSKGGLAVLAF